MNCSAGEYYSRQVAQRPGCVQKRFGPVRHSAIGQWSNSTSDSADLSPKGLQIRSTKCTAFDAFGGFKRPLLACKSLRIIALYDANSGGLRPRALFLDPRRSLLSVGRWHSASYSLVLRVFLAFHSPILVLFRSTSRSTKRAVLHDFGGFRRSPRACKSLKILARVDCHGRGRGFEPRRPRHTFRMTYGTYGPKVTTKSGFDMGVMRNLPPIL